MFNAVPVDESNFVLVSAPIGTGARSQLNIYEQRSNKRPCFAVSGSTQAVDPLLSTFDFTGICNRYIDGNGYSLRIGGDDLGTQYRLTVVNTGTDMELLATPTRNPSQPTFVVARAGGAGSGFLKLSLSRVEPEASCLREKTWVISTAIARGSAPRDPRAAARRSGSPGLRRSLIHPRRIGR